MFNVQISIKVRKLTALNLLNTLFIGNVVSRFDRLPSTNDYAWHLLEQRRPPEGMVVVADYQTAGKGQRGNRWEAAAGLNLTLSIVLYPDFLAARRAFALSQAMALAVRDVVAWHLPGHQLVQVKWPNDVIVGRKKVAGLLIQNSLSGDYLQASVVGIGLNINQRHFPPHLAKATSLACVAESELDREEVMCDLFKTVACRYGQLKQQGTAAVQRDYLAALYGYQQIVCFRKKDGTTFTGVVAGIDESGQLLVDRPKGRARFGLKEVEWI